MKNALLFLGMLVLFFSCSRPVGTTTSKIKIMSGNIAALLSSKANNGLILYGRSDDGKSFAKRIDSDTIDLIFPNGQWNFYAVSWESATPSAMPDMTGKTYCGKASANLTGADTSIQLDLTNSNCNDPAFSLQNKLYNSVTNLPRFKIYNCKDINVPLNNNSCDQNLPNKFNKGYATSYRFIALEYKNFGDITPPQKIAQSVCVRTAFSGGNLAGLPESADITNFITMRVPTNQGNGFKLALEVFYSEGPQGSKTGCDSSGGVDVLPVNENPRMKMTVDMSWAQAPIYNLYVQTNATDICRAPRLSPSQFAAGFGTPGAPYAACTKEQFDLLRSQFTTYKSSSIDLLTDINYNMAQIPPIGDALSNAGGGATNFYGFSGATYAAAEVPVLNGLHHKISNFVINCKLPGQTPNDDVGFFRLIGNAIIKNLTLNSGVIFCDNGNQIGLLAGRASPANSLTLRNIKVHGHAGGGTKVGGIIGQLNTGSDFMLRSVHFKGDVGASSYAGGLIGQMIANATSTVSNSSVYGRIYGNHNGGPGVSLSYAGGLAGSASGPITIERSIVKADRIEGSTLVGGFLGGGTNTTLNDSYAEVNLRASGATDGTSTHIRTGGAIGSSSGAILNRVLVLNSIKSTNRNVSYDHSLGGIVGAGTATCSSSYYTGDHDGLACGTGINHTQKNQQATFTGVTFLSPIKVADWDVAANLSGITATVPSCTTMDKGKFYQVTTAGTTGAFGTLNPGDIIYCNGSSNVLVVASNVSDYLTSGDHTWMMPDEGKDIPRLRFEPTVEDEVAYLKRPCHGHFDTQVGSGTLLDPYWICNEAQFDGMLVNSNYDLKKNIFFSGTPGSYTPKSAGVYKLNGNGFGLYGYSMTVPGTNISADLDYGLFTKLETGSILSNLKIVASELTGTGLSASGSLTVALGVLAGRNNGDLFNVQVDMSKFKLEVTTTAGPHFYAGGALGVNAGNVKRSEFNVETMIFHGNFPFDTTLYAGSVAGSNQGLMEGVRSHSGVTRDILCSSSETLSFSSYEFLGAFLGINESGATLKEIRSEGEFRSDNGGSCPFARSGHISPFVAKNLGTINDFDVSPKLWIKNTTADYLELFATNTGSVNRGLVKIEAGDANRPMNQAHTHGSDWDANTTPSAVNSSTPTCSAALAGTYYNVTSSSASTSLGPVDAGDIVMCNGASNLRIPAAVKDSVMINAMMDVTYLVRNSSPPPLAAGRFLDSDMIYSLRSGGGLYAETVTPEVVIDSAAWLVGSDFFNPGNNVWFLNLEGGGPTTPKVPELFKTGGSLESLGTPF